MPSRIARVRLYACAPSSSFAHRHDCRKECKMPPWEFHTLQLHTTKSCSRSKLRTHTSLRARMRTRTTFHCRRNRVHARTTSVSIHDSLRYASPSTPPTLAAVVVSHEQRRNFHVVVHVPRRRLRRLRRTFGRSRARVDREVCRSDGGALGHDLRHGEGPRELPVLLQDRTMQVREDVPMDVVRRNVERILLTWVRGHGMRVAAQQAWREVLEATQSTCHQSDLAGSQHVRPSVRKEKRRGSSGTTRSLRRLLRRRLSRNVQAW